MEVRPEHFKKAGSTSSDASIETLMIFTYCREKYLSDNKNKDPKTFVPLTKEFNKNLFIHWAISHQVESLNSHFESESKKARNHYHVVQWTKIYQRCSINKGALKVSQNSNTCNRVSNKVAAGHRHRFFCRKF